MAAQASEGGAAQGPQAPEGARSAERVCGGSRGSGACEAPTHALPCGSGANYAT